MKYKSSIGVEVVIALNKCFKRPIHPFNLEDEGKETFAEWEFEQSKRLSNYYLPEIDLLREIQGKTILDIGAGSGGKTAFYALNGARKLIGIDTEERFIIQARDFASSKNAKDIDFIVANAEEMPFQNASFDMCVMNDVFEHVSKPEVVLKEVSRVLKRYGKVFINSPPYFHPYGAHLTDLIGIPYVHLLFPEPVLINAYKKLALETKSAEKRIDLRFGVVDNREQITYINKMTIARFEEIMGNQNQFKAILYKLIPLKNQVGFLLKTPFREFFTEMLVYVGEKNQL
ncbi:class I SAM-dependent methyltransferase [Candidatus Cryosericum septentrionale]|jgi:ubiquinone/menaquinone biosynthesis C-methylase UbiE|uniref:Class I SAM-dependent methyltransferase n=1 Tax=Candidatus Cryosericum septentrionale TaxID=2290913 RepID=A0A398DQI2_9BACT|nr:class I SAM-dependent methyltransferase [Candidatus Cryosericum septentrionale]RIE17485.1 class I SAM-dependent methyltransferase [Candidatus Cryosericum septentrionale]